MSISTNTTETKATTTQGRLTTMVGLAVSVVLVATACSMEAPTVAPPARQTVTTAPAVQSEPVEHVAVLTTPLRAISLVDTLDVVAEPGSETILATLSAHTDFGSARVLMVEEVHGAWVRVQLPVRPNGTSGWVRSSDVSVEEISARVEVDLASRMITTWLDGEVLMQTSVAVGSEANPTPTGVFFITDKVDTGNDDSAYGPFALGLSGYSDTLTEFAGGDGQIGIHGTNVPGSIGQAVSHGCVRLPNHLIAILAAELPLGTPVIVK